MKTCPASPASRRGRAWTWVLAAGVIAAAAVRAPGAAVVRAVAAHLDGLRMAWLGTAVTAQTMALAGGTAAQRQLLGAGGARLPWRTVFGLVLASTGLAKVIPAGPVAGGAWQVREYRRRGAGTGPGLWAVLAGGVTSTVAVLALLLAGAAVAGLGSLLLLACCAAGLLVGGTAGLFAVAHRAHALSRWLSRRRRRSRAIAQLAAAVARLSRQRAGPGSAAGVLAYTGAGLLADAGVLAACFGLAGLPIPWQGLLFAYAAGQLAGRLVPLPGGIGGVEGGVLGALTLTGTSPAAAAAAVIIYRVLGYWAVGAAGTAMAAALARRPQAARLTTHPGSHRPGGPQAVAVPGQPSHRPGGTVVPGAATEDSTPNCTIE